MRACPEDSVGEPQGTIKSRDNTSTYGNITEECFLTQELQEGNGKGYVLLIPKNC